MLDGDGHRGGNLERDVPVLRVEGRWCGCAQDDLSDGLPLGQQRHRKRAAHALGHQLALGRESDLRREPGLRCTGPSRSASASAGAEVFQRDRMLGGR